MTKFDAPQVSDAPIVTEVRGTTGVITLNRPRALNALNPTMVNAMADALETWAVDDAVEQVIVRGAGKHFCTGGDVRWLRERALAGEFEQAESFLDREFTMNALIDEYPKPYIALMNGFVMGGGVGISARGSHRVAAPETKLAMPEALIGFVNDVGTTFTFQHLPARESLALGKFLGLTGYRLSAADMAATGLSTHSVDSFEGLLEQLVEDGPDVLDSCVIDPGEAELPALYEPIEEAFVGSWPEIRERLAGADPEFQTLARDHLESAAPSSLLASTEAFDAGVGASLRECLDNELALAKYMYTSPDFLEGVRSQLVDKTRNPSFEPAPDPEVYRDILRDRPAVVS